MSIGDCQFAIDCYRCLIFFLQFLISGITLIVLIVNFTFASVLSFLKLFSTQFFLKHVATPKLRSINTHQRHMQLHWLHILSRHILALLYRILYSIIPVSRVHICASQPPRMLFGVCLSLLAWYYSDRFGEILRLAYSQKQLQGKCFQVCATSFPGDCRSLPLS